MYHSCSRVPSFLQHSVVFLNVCLWAGCLALTRQVWRGHVLHGNGFAICVLPSGLQCHRAAMQSTGEGTPGVVSGLVRFATLVTSGEGVCVKVWGELLLVGLTLWSLGQGLHLRLPAWRRLCSRPNRKNKKATESHSGHRLSCAFRGIFCHTSFPCTALSPSTTPSKEVS